MQAPLREIAHSNLVLSKEKPKYLNLLPELLYGLLGFTGDVFVDDLEDTPSKQVFHPPFKSSFHISDDIRWIDVSDRMLINEILQMGFHYQQLQKFVAAQQDLAHSLDGNICWRALAIGLEELCTVYHTAVLRVQQNVISDPCPVLSSISHFLSEYAVILPAVHAVLWELVNTPGTDSTAVLDLLYDRSRCGIPALKAVLERLLWHCNQLLYQHLSAWMVHGLLLANNFDFFVVRTDNLVSAAPPSPDPTTSPLGKAPLYSKAGDLLLRPEDELAWAAFDIQQGRVPKYIPAMAPMKILFVGRAVRLLQRPRGALANTELLPHAQVAAWAEDLRQLQTAPTYSSIAFERVINRIHDQVSEALYGLVVNQAQLKQHLHTLKDFMLLYRGDFFHSFLHEGRSLMRLPPRESTAQMDLVSPFQQAAVKSGADQLPLFHLVSVLWTREVPKLNLGGGNIVRLPAFEATTSGQLSWDSIQLRYQLMWPLQLLLTPEAMARYESLFVYLLTIHRAMLALQSVWQHLMTQSKRERGARKRDTQAQWRAWHLRQRMAHFMENLLVYLKVDVIESSYADLLAALEGSTNFSEVRKAHDAFLSRLIHHTFLTTGAICEKLQGITQGCRQLQSVVCEGGKGSLEQISSNFARDSSILFTMLRSQKLQSLVVGGDHVRQLVLRLNLNGFMEHPLRVASISSPPRPALVPPSPRKEEDPRQK